MAVNKVDLYVSQILEDLNNGFTWLKKDDLGYGSIQEKYNAKEQQINLIRKHPKLKDAETTITIFNIIDDTNEGLSGTISTTPNRTGAISVSTIHPTTIAANTTVSTIKKTNTEPDSTTENYATSDDDGFSAFANL